LTRPRVNRYSNSFVLGQDAGLWGDSDDPVWLSIVETTLGATSRRIEQNLVSEEWQQVFQMANGAADAETEMQSIHNSRTVDSEHARDRAAGAIPGASRLATLPRKRCRE
jgi:hypothetical protein